MHLHVTYTGGTIGMVPSPHGLVPGADLEAWLADLLQASDARATLGIDELTFTALDPLIDSANATPESWQAIIDDLRAKAASNHAPDAFVILHGTDTMAYTGAALSYGLSQLPAPVVITGAQLPLGEFGSDAAGNVSGALQAATQLPPGCVSLFFGDRLLWGCRASKNSTWAFTGFDSPNVPPLAFAGAPWKWTHAKPTVCTWENPQPYRRHDVPVIDLAPGISAARLRACLTPRPQALILRAFGVGNLPSNEPGLVETIARTVADGTAVIVTSQCPQGAVTLGQYETGDVLATAGAVGSGDMTLEATYAKVQFLLSQGVQGKNLAAWMTRSLAGEVTPAR